MILYGLPTCDTCRKARKALAEAGHQVTFRDIRTEPLSPQDWAPLLAEFGDNLVNRKSQTWRNLSDFMKESEAEDQLREHPALMKRPVISDGDRLTMGWDASVQAAWGL